MAVNFITYNTQITNCRLGGAKLNRMTVIIYTRDARCKDCEFIRYFYNGKRKLHYCIQREQQWRLNDPICGYYVMRKEYYPKRLTDRRVGK